MPRVKSVRNKSANLYRRTSRMYQVSTISYVGLIASIKDIQILVYVQVSISPPPLSPALPPSEERCGE